MSISKSFFLLAFLAFTAISAVAQTARSPFSRQGLGDLYGDALINTQGMAGVGVAHPQFWFLNSQNPALLVNNSVYSVFHAGMVAESKTLRQDTLSERSVGGNLNYLATAFPIKPGKWTTAIGLMPYSSVNYQVQYIDVVRNSPEDSLLVTEKGSGGLTQLYWANGVRLSKKFAVGLRATYLFGAITNSYSNQLNDTNQPINYLSTVEEKLRVRDFTWTSGVSFSSDSLFRNPRYRLSIGATHTLGGNLNTMLRREKYRATANGPIDSDRDTLSTTNGNTYLPQRFTVGASLSYGAKWMIGAEVSYQDWSKFSTLNQGGESLTSDFRVSLGGEFTPDAFGNSYFKRVTYRTGVSFEQTPYQVDVNDDLNRTQYRSVNDVGINFGLSLPAGRSSLDLAFRYGRRGNIADTIIDETYFRVFFGITFNDQWFIKRKFD